MGSRLVGSDLLTLHRLKPTVPYVIVSTSPHPTRRSFSKPPPQNDPYG